jgi:ribosomal protein L29
MSGHEKDERMKVAAGTLHNQNNDQLIRIIKDLRLDIAGTYGLVTTENAGRARRGLTSLNPNNRFRRRAIARCITILKERGVVIE